MRPIEIKIGDSLCLLAYPDSEAHMNGHPILTYVYDIFKNKVPVGNHQDTDAETRLGPHKKVDPDYMGHITFEQPGKMFTYTADGTDDLSSDEVELVIEQIRHYRDSPNLWII